MSLNQDPTRITTVMEMWEQYLTTLLPDRSELLNRYHAIDVGHKVVGVGSVGLLAFVVLLQGRDDDDLLVLQLKQAVQSVYEPFVPTEPLSPHGKRVVLGQQLMQATSDAFLGWVTGPAGRSYYVRQLRDMKWSPDPSLMSKDAYSTYAALCGAALARAHARSGDAIAIDAYMGTSGKFADSVSSFSKAYVQVNDADFEAFVGLVENGVVSVADNAGRDLSVRVTDEGSVRLGSVKLASLS